LPRSKRIILVEPKLVPYCDSAPVLVSKPLEHCI
jgi:hypothetical protein